MANVMIIGDLHGNTNEALFAVQNAGALGINTIVQCGDFGIWLGKDGMDYLDEFNAALLDAGIMVVFVDGNHEAFPILEAALENNPKNSFGQVFIRSNILWNPRGTTWELGGKRFLGVGGAVSVDKAWRTPGLSWWEQEQLTDSELDSIVANLEVEGIDYLITHDCPSNAPFGSRRKDDLESVIHRGKMDRLGEAAEATRWFHGHLHSKYDGYDFPTYEPTTKVYGLECDGQIWNWGVLDTDTDTFEWGENLMPGEYIWTEDELAFVLPD